MIERHLTSSFSHSKDFLASSWFFVSAEPATQGQSPKRFLAKHQVHYIHLKKQRWERNKPHCYCPPASPGHSDWLHDSWLQRNRTASNHLSSFLDSRTLTGCTVINAHISSVTLIIPIYPSDVKPRKGLIYVWIPVIYLNSHFLL